VTAISGERYATQFQESDWLKEMGKIFRLFSNGTQLLDTAL